MFTDDGKLASSPLTYDGTRTVRGDPNLSVADGAVSLMSYRHDDIPYGVLRFTSELDFENLFAVAAGRIDGNHGIPDPVMSVGYNATPRGSKWLGNENSLGLYFEGHWNDGTNDVMESYLQYDSPLGDVKLRPLFFMIDRHTHRLANAAIRGNPLNILDDLDNPAMEIGSKVTNLYSTYTYLKDPEANIVGTGNMYLKAGVGDTNASLYMAAGGSGSIYLEMRATNPVHICPNGCETEVGGSLVVGGQVQVGGPAGPKWISGTGSPEGAVQCSVGCLYTRTDGGPGSTLYVKESGTGTLGWAAK
jgi:hypothetical protein